MNKKSIFTSAILFFIFLFAAVKIYSQTSGTCFDVSIGACDYPIVAENCPFPLEFHPNEQPYKIENCTLGCCCAAGISGRVYPVTRGECEILYESVFVDVGNEQECNSICGLVTPQTPLCNISCKINNLPCVGKARIINGSTGNYYCWEKDQVYDTAELCNIGCNKIEQCTGGMEITSPGCYCGVNLYTSGYCCWDGVTHVDSLSSCPPANVCEKHRYLGAGPFFRCCDACKGNNASEYWSGGDSACNYEDGRETCCKECAPAYQDCCERDWQCIEPSPYDYNSCEGIACNVSCIQSECVFGERINSSVNAEQECNCAGEYYDTSSNSNYCCVGGLSSSPCGATTFNLWGYVYTGTLELDYKIPDAHLTIKTRTGTYTATTINDLYNAEEHGKYYIEGIPFGTGLYNVSVVKEGFEPATFALPYPASSPIREDFNITAIAGACDEFNPQSPTTFTARPMRGIKAVNLTWRNPCSSEPSKVVSYSLRRVPASNPTIIQLGSESFVDYNINWSNFTATSSNIKTYIYYIRANYISGANSSEASASITMGHHYCEGIFGNGEFCLSGALTKSGDPTKRYKCNNQNNLSLQQDCQRDNAYCAGPDANNATICKTKSNCNYADGNPFGLFYTETECLGSNKYCYYDYSDREFYDPDTIVDDCSNCTTLRDCYGYKSQGACLTDNCGKGGVYSSEGNKPCLWYNKFEELGKGICYDEDYIGTGYCGLCNRNSTAFYNSNCPQDVCTKLGACYSRDMSCESCMGNSKCEDFANSESCVNSHSKGNRSISINGCPADITRSDDACNLGACKWGDPIDDMLGNIKCFKDANDDDTADCANSDTVCKEDFEPFTTIPQANIPKLSNQSYGIHFYLTEGGTGDLHAERPFYFCIDKNNSCCPNTLKGDTMPSTRDIIIDPLTETDVITEVGTYFIRYYSIDDHNNVEEVKSTEIFVDPIPPKITFGHFNYADSEHNYAKIIAAADEYVACTYNLNNLPAPISTNFNSGINNSFFIEFRDLNDGNYVFTTNCNDMVGNSVQTDYRFIIDNIHQITIFSPDGQVLNITSVKFNLQTSDNSNCSLRTVNASNNGIPYNKLPSEPLYMQQRQVGINLYNHTYGPITLKENVSYIVKATCIPDIGGSEDTGFFLFTIDKQPPNTSTDFDFSVYHRLPHGPGSYLAIKFDCHDKEINGTPGEAGCAGVYLCTGENCYLNSPPTYVFLPDMEYQTSSSRKISYYSVDNVGNKEPNFINKNKEILIDRSNPTVIFNPNLPYFTNTRQQQIRVVAYDDLAIHHIEIRTQKIDPPQLQSIINATNTPAGSDFYSSNMVLYGGLNEITATACDNALSCVQTSQLIYLDIYPPNIGAITITDYDSDIDENNIFEYAQNLSFNVQIDDNHTAGAIIRGGIGINPSSVKLFIYNSSKANLASPTMVRVGSDLYYQYFYQNITSQLKSGEYNATIRACDNFGSCINKTEPFKINDTIEATFTLKIYDSQHNLVFDPSQGIRQELNVGTYTVNISFSEEMSLAKLNYSFESDYGIKDAIIQLSTKNNREFNGTLKIPDDHSNLYYYEGLHFAMFNVDFIELAGLRSVEQVPFTINVFGPTAPTLYIPSKQNPQPYPEKLAVYYNKTKVSGNTNDQPGLRVRLYQYSSRYAEKDHETISYGIPTINPTLVGMNPTLAEAPPQKVGSYIAGERDLYLRGYTWYQKFNNQAYKYIQIDNQDVFYEIDTSGSSLTIAQVTIQGTQYTRITIKGGLEMAAGIGDSIKAYNQRYPAGYFEFNVNLTEGENNFTARSVSSSGLFGTPSLIYTALYDNTSFEVSITNPSDGVINYNDFNLAGNSIPLQITTEKEGISFQTTCKITHIKDIIAENFTETMESGDGVTHTFAINANSCKENDGHYCLVGGTINYPYNYHRYKVNCTPAGIQMDSKSINICFTVSTFGGSAPNYQGGNICSFSTGCGTSIPTECPPIINCNTLLNQPACTGWDICRWCPSSSSCLQNDCSSCGGLTDSINGVCTAPPQPVVCADSAHNTLETCTQSAQCRWCPLTNACLQDNCNSCGDLTAESGRICTSPGTGGGGIWIVY